MSWTERSFSDWRRSVQASEIRTSSNKVWQVQNKKQRDTAAQDAEMIAKRKAGEQKESDKENSGGGDILGDADDADVIF